MPARRREKASVEARLTRLRELRAAAPGDDLLAQLREALGDRANLVVAEAARLAADHRLEALVPDLLAAFDRMFADPAKVDPQCHGKTAIVKALTRLEAAESAPFIRGARHVQPEPVWGGQEDSAGDLRAASLVGLVQCTDVGRGEVCRRLVDALADAADVARANAVRALAVVGGEEAALVLRLKARLGDPRPAVVGHVFDAILAIEESGGVSFVAEYLDDGKAEIRDEAAFALAACREPEAVVRLMEAWKQAPLREARLALLRALGSSRQPAAIAFVLDVIREGSAPEAAAARDALLSHADSEEVRARIQRAFAGRP